MKIFKVNFKPMYPVGGCLIVSAGNRREAYQLACQTIKHTKISIQDVQEVELNGKPQVIVYESGDY